MAKRPETGGQSGRGGSPERVELPENLRLQRTVWRIQRIGWTAMTLLVLLAVAGLFGSGPLAHATVSDACGARLEYPRFARQEAAFELRLRIPADCMGSPPLEIWIDERYLDSVQVERVTPEAESESLAAGGVRYAVRAVPSGAAASVTLHVKPQEAGALRGRLAVGRRPPMPFSHFVYP